MKRQCRNGCNDVAAALVIVRLHVCIDSTSMCGAAGVAGLTSHGSNTPCTLVQYAGRRHRAGWRLTVGGTDGCVKDAALTHGTCNVFRCAEGIAQLQCSCVRKPSSPFDPPPVHHPLQSCRPAPDTCNLRPTYVPTMRQRAPRPTRQPPPSPHSNQQPCPHHCPPSAFMRASAAAASLARMSSLPGAGAAPELLDPPPSLTPGAADAAARPLSLRQPASRAARTAGGTAVCQRPRAQAEPARPFSLRVTRAQRRHGRRAQRAALLPCCGAGCYAAAAAGPGARHRPGALQGQAHTFLLLQLLLLLPCPGLGGNPARAHAWPPASTLLTW